MFLLRGYGDVRDGREMVAKWSRGRKQITRTITHPRRRPLLPLQRKDAPRIALRSPHCNSTSYIGDPSKQNINRIQCGAINEKKRDNIPRKKRSKMIAELIIPIETLRGQLRKDGYYFRLYKGKQIVQRCPNRKGHVKTASEQANQERFVEKYRKKKRAQK